MYKIKRLLFIMGVRTYMRPCRSKAFICTVARSLHVQGR